MATELHRLHGCLCMCAVSWYKYKGVEPGLYNCPVVSKNYLDYPDGNFEFADNLEPVAISVVPYIGKTFQWLKVSK